MPRSLSRVAASASSISPQDLDTLKELKSSQKPDNLDSIKEESSVYSTPHGVEEKEWYDAQEVKALTAAFMLIIAPKSNWQRRA